jgi:hypothetical protein
MNLGTVRHQKKLNRNALKKRARAMVIYSLLEVGELLGGQGVSLADDGDDVDSGAEALHQLNVDFSEAGTEEQRRKKRTRGQRDQEQEQGPDG